MTKPTQERIERAAEEILNFYKDYIPETWPDEYTESLQAAEAALTADDSHLAAEVERLRGLLDAKDAEIAELRQGRIYTDNSKAAALLQVENTHLKALLEQAREGLEPFLRAFEVLDIVDFRLSSEGGHSEKYSVTIGIEHAGKIIKTLAAINEATGE